MAILLDKQGTQHYANKMVLGENRKVNGKPLTSALTEIDTKLTEMKGLFDQEYGTALDMTLENTDVNSFKVGTGSGVDRSGDVVNSFTDLTIKGRTLQNLVKKSTPYEIRAFGLNVSQSISTLNHVKGVTSEKEGSTPSYLYIAAGKVSNIAHMLKPNTFYTVFFEVFNVNCKIHYFALTNGDTLNPLTHGGVRISKNAFRLTTNNLETPITNQEIYIGLDKNFTGEIEVKNAMILEGDWTNKEIPQYFEGMQSIGEKPNEQDKISISSIGRNLFNGNDNTYTVSSTSSHPDRVSIGNEVKSLIGLTIPPDGLTFKAKAKGVNHTSLENPHYGLDLNFKFSDGSEGWNDFTASSIGVLGEGTIEKNTVFNMKKHAGKTIVGFASNIIFTRGTTGTFSLSDIEISSGNTSATPYEPHKVNKKEILLNEPLRGVPGGVRDSCELVEGKWKLIRRCGVLTLTGKENWTNGFGAGDGVNNRFEINIKTIDGVRVSNKKAICTDFLYESTGGIPKVGSFRISYTEQLIYLLFNISTSIVPLEDIEAWKRYITGKNIQVIYELDNPIIEDIDPVTLQVWKGGVIDIDENVPVTTTHTVALNKTAQIKKNIEELTVLKNRVEEMEKVYDQATLEQTHKLELLAQNFELDNISKER